MHKPHYPVRTRRLALRPFTGADHAALHSWQSRPDVVRYLYDTTRTPAQTAESLARKMALTWPEKEGDHLTLAVVADGRVIGEVSLKWVSAVHRQGEVGYLLHPDHHGHGYATEAAAALLHLAFANLGLHRVVACCHARNEPSWRVMERLGMRREAHYRHHEVFKGAWADGLVYAILDEEWHRMAEHHPRPTGA
ncbi:GNAT family N-acetyltransferase [Saccharothrix sp. Mg75]|uniref:GNAT family N-acetyltransferase n=1 Tax=Saccharothrix sp. Mg75 TaxID=3445357 RepID=UPI003EE92052